jgi:Putative DNA-binding domain
LLGIFSVIQNTKRVHRARKPRSTGLGQYLLARQSEGLDLVKREKWTESELDDLPAEEPDNFDRKAGKLFDDKDAFLTSVAKALSAFANSGGGSLILGVQDDGAPDGLPCMVGRAKMRDWIEQKIPHLLDYPLSDFRVHTVIKDTESRIPAHREVIVIDVGDSAAAPHQSKRENRYFYRVAGRSEPAPHFYLELLRQRLSAPVLEYNLSGITTINADEYDDGIFVETKLNFVIKNVGRVASYDWNLSIREINNSGDGVLPERIGDFRASLSDYPVKRSRSTGIPVNTTILPGCEYPKSIDFGFHLRPKAHTMEALREEARLVISDTTIFLRLATESSPGELIPIHLSSVLDLDLFETEVRQKCLRFFHI